MVPRNQLKKSYFYNAAYTFFINERRKVNMLNSADKTAKKKSRGCPWLVKFDHRARRALSIYMYLNADHHFESFCW